MRRRNVPCSPCSGGSSSGDCCGLKEKLRILWDRTIGSILRINGISPDGDGDFTIEAGDNIQLTERGTGNGLRISTTGGISYYESGDSYVNVDNNDLEISVNVGTGGLAKDDDLQTVAQAVTDILDGTSTVPEATHATSADSATSAGSATNATNTQYLGSASSNVGDNTHPIKIVNGVAVVIPNEFVTIDTIQTITAKKRFNSSTLTIYKNTNIASNPSSYDACYLQFDDNVGKCGELRRDGDATYQRTLINVVDRYRNNEANLDVRINANGQAQLILRKNLNGTTSSTTITTL